ncbi:ArgE/DapE family deacylase [Paeniroseomonas aquatica]|uniref:ArgE/DapE family deacylase n=1 Tax=Paeniroseomonas aquatica TaxID=373043 RepID=A0ABT7ZZI8_9PROT|nr:ArgE/DapE family deacylase [Paeniroseomonas aquatica]MDN3562885.1 ArgE/DapE family deacylase [Paeniroseomonas aquatica]
MPDAALLARLAAAVDANFEKEVGFLADLVRFPSTRGNEAPLQDWMARQLAARGYGVDRYTLAEVPLAAHPKASPMVDVSAATSVQVVATHRAANPTGRSLILQGHIDVVPAGPEEMWTYPPYSATIRDGWMYGRGAHDMKSGVAAMVFAMDALKAAGLEPAADVHVQTVTEEESTGNGALSTLVRGYRAEAALIPEPTGGTITRAHTGTLWFRIKVRGVPVHVAVAQSGSNAIMSAYHLIQALQAHTATLNEAAKHHEWYAGIEAPLKFNPGIIRGGDWASSTPAWCEVDCRIGLLPGADVAEIQRGVERCVDQAAKSDNFLANNPPLVEWHGFLADGYVLEPGTEAEAVLAAAHAQVFGEQMPARITTAVNDTRFYGLYFGIPGLCYGPKGEGAHAFDERTSLDHLKQTTLAIAAFIADWCGARPVS